MSKRLLAEAMNELIRLRDLIDNDHDHISINTIVDKIEKSLAPKTTSTTNPLAIELSKELIEAMTRATGRTLLTTPTKSAPYIQRLLKAGVAESDIRKAIVWLEKVNPTREWKFVVLSGQALYEKWDKIFTIVNETKQQTIRKEYF